MEEEDVGEEQAKADVHTNSQEVETRMLMDGTDVNIPMDVMKEDKVEEMELGELDLDALKK